MGYYIDTDSNGNYLPAKGKVEALIKDGATKITGEKFTEPIFVANGSYNAWTDINPAAVNIKFSAKGYDDKTVLFYELMSEPNVSLDKGGNSSYMLLALGAGLLLIAKKKKKKPI